jgi:hypothetical protein
MTKHRGRQPENAFLTYMGKDVKVHTFKAPDAAQFKRAAYLEGSFLQYATDIGCVVVHDEISATEDQAMMLRSWWEEHRL